jgi:pseudouridine-5'-phosphate glycosidase
VPATIAVLDGVVRIGLDDDGLVRVAEDPDVVKAGTRDLAVLLARRASGATTVAATSYLAHLAGIRVFATGGLGGVHRGARATRSPGSTSATPGCRCRGGWTTRRRCATS